jgi:hypothetical protein
MLLCYFVYEPLIRARQYQDDDFHQVQAFDIFCHITDLLDKVSMAEEKDL